MKEARHIATGKIVQASEVDYRDYYGVFQCPNCKVVLRLRKEHTLSDGTTRTAAFIHPPGETELEKKCHSRININFGNTKLRINFPQSREQCFKLLEQNFLKCLEDYSKVSITEHYSTNESALESILIFINLNNKIIAARQNGRYILNLEKSQRIKKVLQHKTYTQKTNSLYTQKTNNLIWGLEFLIYQASDDFIEKTLDYIFGKYVDNRKVKGIEYKRKGIEYKRTKHKKNNVFLVSKIEKVLGFELSIIKQADQILSNDKLIDDFFVQMYKKEFSGSNADIFNETKKIHNAVFEYIINYLVDFPWECLLS